MLGNTGVLCITSVGVHQRLEGVGGSWKRHSDETQEALRLDRRQPGVGDIVQSLTLAVHQETQISNLGGVKHRFKRSFSIKAYPLMY